MSIPKSQRFHPIMTDKNLTDQQRNLEVHDVSCGCILPDNKAHVQELNFHYMTILKATLLGPNNDELVQSQNSFC